MTWAWTRECKKARVQHHQHLLARPLLQLYRRLVVWSADSNYHRLWVATWPRHLLQRVRQPLVHHRYCCRCRTPYSLQMFHFTDTSLLSIALNIVFSAGVLSMIFVRLSRPQPRARSILFSRNAVMKLVEGRWRLKFRVVELRKHQLTEAHLRCYAIFAQQSASGERHFVQREMRLAEPNDNFG